MTPGSGHRHWRDDGFLFFRCNCAHCRFGQQQRFQNIVGDNIELFLLLALHVFRAGRAQHASQCAAVDLARDIATAIGDGVEHRDKRGLQRLALEHLW